MRLIIVGAGGHAQVVADILHCMRLAGHDIHLIGYLDDATHLHAKTILDAPVLGPINLLAAIEHDGLVVAIGDNAVRSRFFEKYKAEGEQLIVAKHPASLVSADVSIGAGSMICAGVVINTGSLIGEDVILNTGCTIDHHSHVGSHAHVAPGVHSGGEVSIGQGTLVGIGSTILPRCRIGNWTVVGGASLVNRDLPDSVTAFGVPARVMNHA
jgi:sugar O-acyltransferase (sialic acid O-acetyltransferase NeuD family)